MPDFSLKNYLKNPWPHRLALLTVFAVLGLLCSGGLVTSHGVGLSVPDWPNTFGYNMFLFPVSKWIGGVFFEHTHRLWASGVGFLTLILAIILQVWEERAWVRRLGWLALGAVILQGVLGGLRVTLLKDQIGIFHACLAQSFFVLTGLIALFTSSWWVDTSAVSAATKVDRRWLWGVAAICCLLFVQLALGATMRHAHRGLAIPDFPLAYGKLWPQLDPKSMEKIDETRFLAGEPETTPTQIRLQLFHRLVGTLIVLGICSASFSLLVQRQVSPLLKQGTAIWLTLVFIQFALGAATIWTHKAADVATAHVAFGALTFLTGCLLLAAGCRLRFTSNPFHRLNDIQLVSKKKNVFSDFGAVKFSNES